MQTLKIILLCIAAACVYGIAHDQITARICIEYFTIGHPVIVRSDSPTVIGLVWGVVATWWMGVIIGVPLAIAARAGRRPKRSASSLVRPVVGLLLVMGLLAVAAGVVGHLLAAHGWVILIGPLADRVPEERHTAFLTALWAHSASYLSGSVGGVVLVISAWRSRKPMALPVPPSCP